MKRPLKTDFGWNYSHPHWICLYNVFDILTLQLKDRNKKSCIDSHRRQTVKNSALFEPDMTFCVSHISFFCFFAIHSYLYQIIIHFQNICKLLFFLWFKILSTVRTIFKRNLFLFYIKPRLFRNTLFLRN